jgi:transposase
MPVLAELVDGVIGVDTHRDSLAAAALSSVGGVLSQTAVSADAAGYQTLLSFADVHLAGRCCWAIEAAGSYGAGLAAFLRGHGEQLVEAGRPKRPPQRSSAKPMPSTPSALPVTPSASRPSSWLQCASGATTRRCGCC